MSGKDKTPEQKAIDAFDSGVENPVTELPPVQDDDEVIDDKDKLPKPGEQDGEDVVDNEDEVDDSDPESVAAAEKKGADRLAAEGKKPDAKDGKDKQPKDKPADDGKDKKPAPNKADLDEADKLQLKGSTRERFVQLATSVREQGELITVLQKPFEGLVDFTDPKAATKQLQFVANAAKDQVQWDQEMERIGLQPEQFGRLMGYGAAINSTDPKVLENAREVLLQELGFIDGKLGRKSEFHDPLAEFPDLQKKVAEGKLDEEDAVETARLRKQAKAGEQRQQQQDTATLTAQAEEQGLAQIRNVGAAARKLDGDAVFKAKMQLIGPALEVAVKSAPPAKWGEIAKNLYEAAVLPAPPARRALPGGKAPVRQNPMPNQTQVRQPTNALDAFDVGVEEAKAQGY